MKYVDEFRDGGRIRALADEIGRLVDPQRRYRIMEICGGHTHAIFRFGLHQLLPANVELIHGPGCPVCVLPASRIDVGLELAERNDMIFAAFGDVMRVPGAHGSPLDARARGLDVRMIYSPLDALRIAREHPDRRVMYFAIGFETTAPSTAATLLRAGAQGVRNFSVFCNHILVNPALRALLAAGDVQIDAFLGPGHVSTVIGCEPYRFIAESFGRPLVVSGFEPVDLLQSIAMLVRQLNNDERKIENQYGRAVSWDGNRAALAALDRVFEVRETFPWRGLGEIPDSAYRLRDPFRAWDAERFAAAPARCDEVEGAMCGAVLQGHVKPCDCPLFGRACTPEAPLGALMVSSEGACAAQYKYANLTFMGS